MRNVQCLLIFLLVCAGISLALAQDPVGTNPPDNLPVVTADSPKVKITTPLANSNPQPATLEQANNQPPVEYAPLGLLEPQEITGDASVPKDLLWKPKYGDFIIMDSFRIRLEDGTVLKQVNEDPKKGEFRVRLDGCIRFPKDYAKKKFHFSYKFAPRRVAILPSIRESDYKDAAPTLEAELAKLLSEKGMVCISTDDIADAISALGIQLPQAGPNEMMALGKRLNAAFLILPSVGANEGSVFAGFSTYGRSTSTTNTTVSGTAYSNPNSPYTTYSGNAHSSTSKKSSSTSTALFFPTMSAGVGVMIIDGNNGKTVLVRTGQDKRVIPFSYAATRKDIIRDLAQRIIEFWRGE